ncbi:unnamed protein product [Mytilus edulis]|uniref:Uncharacterized protein n=1 Tax=Mytilus edulis TaxID=6550 RepID=A0A8S3RQ47_MYTED|nr:unnamed protein product [Mytilus edulis]
MVIPDELKALIAAIKLSGKEPDWKFSASTDQVTVQLTWTKAKEQEASSSKPKPALKKGKPPSTRRRDAKRYDQWMANKTAVVPATQIQQTTITQTEARDSVVGHVLTPTKYKGEPVGVVVGHLQTQKASPGILHLHRGKRSRIDFDEGFDIDDPDLLRTPPHTSPVINADSKEAIQTAMLAARPDTPYQQHQRSRSKMKAKRQTDTGDRLRKMLVHVGKNLETSNMELCDQFIGPAVNGQVIVTMCNTLPEGQIVKLTSVNDEPTFFHLTEVEVYGV